MKLCYLKLSETPFPLTGLSRTQAIRHASLRSSGTKRRAATADSRVRILRIHSFASLIAAPVLSSPASSRICFSSAAVRCQLRGWIISFPLLSFFCSGLGAAGRSEEHTSELQSQSNLVCRLLLEKTIEDSSCGARRFLRCGRARARRAVPCLLAAASWLCAPSRLFRVARAALPGNARTTTHWIVI